MNLSNLPSILSGVLVVVAVATAAWGALSRDTLKTVRESNKDLLERVGILEAAEVRNHAEILKLSGENETLRSVITNEVHLVSIESALDAHHKAAEKWWTVLDGRLKRLVDVLEKGES